MKTLLSVLIVVATGLAGLALVFMDLSLPTGPGRVLVGAGLYLAAGFGLGRLHAAGRPLSWAILSGWGLMLLGVIGVWITFTDSASGDWTLALLFLLGPAAAAGIGGWAAVRRSRGS